jgi:hypothetical protein
MVAFLRDSLVDEDGRPASVLARVFKTHRFADLDDEHQALAVKAYPEASAKADLRCLVLLATQGDEEAWCSRQTSRGHRVIPLPSEEMISRAPMISRLLEQFGAKLSHVLRPDPSVLLDARETTFNVFHIEQAAGSEYIPAQDEFVIPYGVKSVLGFGGMVATGDMFAAILFSRVAVSPAVAEHFRVVGLNFKLAMLPMVRKPLFEA